MTATVEDIAPGFGFARTGYVLLVEDNPVSAAVATAMLANLGFGVDVVADGAEAVQAASVTSYLAILLDCQIPVLDGYQTAREIRRLESGSRHTPIIAVTATPMRSGQEASLDAGMDDYLVKPFTLKALAAILARWTPDRTLRTSVLPQARPATRVEPAAATGDAPAVLDSEVVARLRRLGAAAGEDLFGHVATLFLADARVRVIALRDGLDREDAAAVSRSAHMLSGASANLGADHLARLCAALASDGAACRLTGARARLAAVEAELDRVRAALHPATRVP